MSHPVPAKFRSNGCHLLFTPTGLGSHLRQTTHTACKQIYLAQRTYVPQLPEENNPGDALARQPSPTGSAASDREFLALADEDNRAGDSMDENDPEIDDIDDSDDSDEPPAGWEPAVRENADAHMASPVVGPAQLPEDPAVQPREELVEERFLARPHITRFPGAQAGAPIRTETPAYTQYAHDIPDSEDNPWSLFASQVDWEIAKWAKLRGSTSTAVTDLLSIEGVSFFRPSSLFLNVYVPFLLRQFIRFLRHWDYRTRILVNLTKSSTTSYRPAGLRFRDRRLS